VSPSVDPFDEIKYKALMDGRECSELMYSYVCKDNRTFRFDAEFFSKTAIHIEQFIKDKQHYFLKTEDVVSGPFGSTLTSESYLLEGDIPFVRIENIKGGFYINRNNLVFISSADNERISNSQLYTDDLILSKVGNSIGFFARVDDELGTCNISENNIGIKLSSYPEEEKHCILAYLNSKYGQILLLRRKSGNAQPKLNVDDVCFIPIPVFGREFMNIVSKAIRSSDRFIRESKKVYESAVTLLLSAINYSDEKISSNAITEKKLSESFEASGRLDAEYYQPKYDDLFNIILRSKTKVLGEIVDMNKSIEPGSECYSDKGIPFIRVSDLSIMGIDTPSIRIPCDIIPSIEKLYPSKDTILFSKDGSVGIAYKLEEDIEMVTSSALLHFVVKNTNEVLPDYLALLLNSNIVQLQAERDASGAVIKHWKPGDIEKVIIPILPMVTQRKIAETVQKSFMLRRQAEGLVKVAVDAVRIAIDDNEKAALSWIEEQNVKGIE